jgi:VanZ like family
VICIILVAGLWPFHAPKNSVSWLGEKNGLRFDSYGTVLSSKPFHPMASNSEPSCSLEIWLVSGPLYKGTILAFGDDDDLKVPLALRQIGENLAIERYAVDAQGNVTRPWLTIERVFDDGPVFLTVTSGNDGTRVYVDGVLAKEASGFGLKKTDFAGRLILGTSTIHDSWTGQILGMATYSEELGVETIARHFHSWVSARRPTLAAGESADVLYLFDERAGNIVHNERDADTNLIIPAHYRILHNPFLQSPWGAYRDRWSAAYYWSYWQDAVINIAGFVPVGFCFVVYFSSVKRWQHPGAAAVLLGFTLSLMIEILQAFLPTRDSGLTDVVTNTAGTCLGVMLHNSSLIRSLWTAALESASGFLD